MQAKQKILLVQTKLPLRADTKIRIYISIYNNNNLKIICLPQITYRQF